MAKQDDLALVVRVVGFSAVVPLALLVAPLLTTQLIAERGLAPSQIGLYFMFELGGISLASLPALWWMKRFSTGRIATVAAVVFVLGNLASVVAQGFAMLLLVRLVAALGGGALMILCMKAAGASARRDRLFGYWIGGQLVLGAAGLALLPRLFAHFGIEAFYAGMALVMLALLPLAPGFTLADAPAMPAARAPGRGRGLAYPLASMATVFCFYVGLGGSWAFLSVIAAGAGLEGQAVADRLAIASLLGIAGALSAAMLGGRVARGRVLVLGYALLFGAILLFMGGPGLTRFALGAYVFKFGWTFALPFVLAAIASGDRDGSIMAAVNLVIGTGTSLGPVAAGWVLESAGPQWMLGLCAAMVAVSFLLLMLLTRGRADHLSSGSMA